MLAQKPVFIVMGAPGTKPGLARYRCMTCRESYPITTKARNSLLDIKARRLMYVIVCYECYTDMERAAPNRPMTTGMGMELGRKILGLDD